MHVTFIARNLKCHKKNWLPLNFCSICCPSQLGHHMGSRICLNKLLLFDDETASSQFACFLRKTPLCEAIIAITPSGYGVHRTTFRHDRCKELGPMPTRAAWDLCRRS